MKPAGYKIITKEVPIIDEMIEYLEDQLFHVKAWLDKDKDDWEDEAKKLKKFITYLEKHNGNISRL